MESQFVHVNATYIISGIRKLGPLRRRLEQACQCEPDISFLSAVWEEEGTVCVSFLASGRSWSEIGVLTDNVLTAAVGRYPTVLEKGFVRD